MKPLVVFVFFYLLAMLILDMYFTYHVFKDTF